MFIVSISFKTFGVSRITGILFSEHFVNKYCNDSSSSFHICPYFKHSCLSFFEANGTAESFNSGKEKCKKTQTREFKTNSLDKKCTGPFTIVG